MPSDLPFLLRYTRLRLKMTQQELSEVFQVSRATINRLERGRHNRRPLHSRERMRIWALLNQPPQPSLHHLSLKEK